MSGKVHAYAASEKYAMEFRPGENGSLSVFICPRDVKLDEAGNVTLYRQINGKDPLSKRVAADSNGYIAVIGQVLNVRNVSDGVGFLFEYLNSRGCSFTKSDSQHIATQLSMDTSALAEHLRHEEQKYLPPKARPSLTAPGVRGGMQQAEAYGFKPQDQRPSPHQERRSWYRPGRRYGEPEGGNQGRG